VSRFDRRNRGGDGVGDRGGAYRETRASGSPPRDAIPGLVASCSGWWRAGNGGGGGAGGRRSAGAQRAGGRAGGLGGAAGTGLSPHSGVGDAVVREAFETRRDDGGHATPRHEPTSPWCQVWGAGGGVDQVRVGAHGAAVGKAAQASLQTAHLEDRA
jgi:hypothetical protein